MTARDIAADVVKVYRDYRNESTNRVQERQLAELNKAVKEQEDRVEESRKLIATISRTGSYIAKPEMTEDEVKKAMDELRSQDLIDATRDFETNQTLLQKLKLKLVGETIELKTPNENIVIHEEPKNEKS